MHIMRYLLFVKMINIMVNMALHPLPKVNPGWLALALPPLPPPPPPPPAIPPPPPDSEFPYSSDQYKLTAAEPDRFRRLGCYIPNLDPAKKIDQSIFYKQSLQREYHPDILAHMERFPPHEDTVFMKSPPRFVLSVASPTKGYLDISTIPSDLASKPRTLLLILDLNGTLLFRNRGSNSSHKFARRARLTEFLDYVFANFKVMIWTTTTPANATQMVNALLTPQQRQHVVAIWDRDRFNLSREQYNGKTTVYKRLEWVWNDPSIQSKHPNIRAGEGWDQTNTILLDDSFDKAKAQPYNHIHVPEFEGLMTDKGVKYGDVLEQVAGYLQEVRQQTNVSRFIRDQPFEVDEKVGGDEYVGGWYRNCGLIDEVDPTGERHPSKGVSRNLFMMGYGGNMMQWG